MSADSLVFDGPYFRDWPDGARTAWVKLDVLTAGLAVDCELLAKNVPGYPEDYRVKRAHKQASLCDGKLVDSCAEPVPSVPEELLLDFAAGKSSIVKVNVRQSSPVSLECGPDARLHVGRPGAYQIPCSLVRRRLQVDCPAVIGMDRVSVLGYEGCSGWLNGKQCLFCDSNPRRSGEISPIPSLNDLRARFAGDLDAWFSEAAKTYFPILKDNLAKIAGTIRPHLHLHIMSGNVGDLDRMWRYHLDLRRAIAASCPAEIGESYLNLLPPRDPVLLQHAHDAGFRQVIFNMEVCGEADYQEVCPEKAALMPMPLFLERLEQAVEVFGRGNVRCGLVFGAQDEARTRLGIERLMEKGVACSTTVFTPKRGTPWARRPAPEARAVAVFSLFLARLMVEHGLRPLYCRLSSRSEVLWELLEDNAP